ncbi:MAG: hypothetical protein H7X70_00115, partial [Candidatus Kapabacteria bacterium]|nr:hypothetical protein [Candidatus Kapabacteria bacterium]
DFMHCTQPLVLWQGASFTTPPQLASYNVRRGYNMDVQALPQLPTPPTPAEILQIIHRFAGIRYGLFDMRSEATGNGGLLFHDDPDTYLDWRPMASVNGIMRPAALPIQPTEDIDHYLQVNPGGILANIERVLRLDYAAQTHMLFGNTPWLGQVWLNFHMQVRGHAEHFASFLNSRPRSMTEARVALWLPVMLGAKGLMLYRGQTSREGSGQPFPADPNLFHDPYKPPIPPSPGPDNLENGLMGWFDPNPLTPPPFPVDMAARRTWFLGAAAGIDWLDDNDPTNVAAYFRPDFQTVRTSLNDNDNDPTTSRLWIGTRSIRNVSVEVLDKLHAMRTVLGRSTNGRTEADPHILTQMRLEDWYGHGFTTINVSRVTPSPLGLFVDLDNIAGRLRTRHPHRNRDVVAANGNPGHFNFEDEEVTNQGSSFGIDSTFIDITAFSLPNDRTMTNSAVIGLMNRRTDSRMLPPGAAYQNSNTSNWNNVSYDEWQARGAAERYGQRGAREVTLPFNYTNADNRYRLLRIREMGGGIDTVIGQDRELAVRLLPGEGKMFQVDVLPADDAVRANNQDAARGFLDHNTQRKIVHFPQIAGWSSHTESKPALGDNGAQCTSRTYFRTVNGPTMRYHVVYHRRWLPDYPLGAGNNLDVFYQRSAEMPIRCLDETDCADQGNVTWEDPITLNSHIVVSTSFNPFEQRYDTVMIDPLNRPSCGYPSVVVRYDPFLQKSRVYVVYACEVDNQATHNIAIYEAQLDADVVAPTQANDYKTAKGRSFLLDKVKANLNCPENDRLRNWGTPVINASYNGNYYAWSDYVRGIVYSHKIPNVRQLTPADLKSVKIDNGNTATAQFPTLNTYSRLHIGETECALAWQEGHWETSCSDGEKIYYTQLSLDATNKAMRGLHTKGTLNNSSSLTLFSWDPVRAENTVALVSNADDFNSKPSLLRTLSDYDQEGFTSVNSVISQVGIINHKADRIFWTNRWLANASAIARRPIDVVEMSVCTATETGNLSAGSVGYIFGLMALSNPEVSLGEAKAVLNGLPAAQSWAYDDTSYVLNFNQATYNPLAPTIWHTSFGWKLMGQNIYSTVDQAYGVTDLKTLAYVHKNSLKGRFPHSSTTYSQTLAFGLTKGRRIFEQGPLIDLDWNQAPTIWRSAEGFYKRKSSEAQSENSHRMFIGYRNEEFEALIAQPMIDGEPAFLLKRAPKDLNAVGVTSMVSEWTRLSSSFDLSIAALCDGDAFDHAEVYLERESDQGRLPLPVFENKTGKLHASARTKDHEWNAISDTKERYRLVVECDVNSAEEVIDIELEPQKEMAKTGLSEQTILDLTTMTLLRQGASQSGALRLFVSPNPANEVLSVVVLGSVEGATTEIFLSNLRGEQIGSIVIQPGGMLRQSFDVSNVATGTYIVGVKGASARTLVQIFR